MKNKDIAVCLISGGMDSCVCACIAKKKHDIIIAIHISYGQRTSERELKAFNDISDYLDITKRYLVELSYFRDVGNSALTDYDIPVPENSLSDDEIPVSYVPFRNANFLSVATSYAEANRANSIYIGANQLDSSGYPDCREEFFNEFNKLIKTGTKPNADIKIITPLINMTKEQIVKKGAEINAPLHLTWSCYKNSQKACGVCDSCLLRLRGFRDAGVQDPLEYEHPVKY
jgi:7-cyano-7-deazaguanine synthase